MSKTEQQYFDNGRTIQTYMDEMSVLKEESNTVYTQFELPEDNFIGKLAVSNLHFLVITEDWCGDAMMINPVLRKITEEAGVEMHVARRDSNLELMDKYLTNGGRAIPMVIILNKLGEVVGSWGPRAPKVQELVEDMRSVLPNKEDPSYEEENKKVIFALRDRYKEEPKLWQYVYESFRDTVLALI